MRDCSFPQEDLAVGNLNNNLSASSFRKSLISDFSKGKEKSLLQEVNF